MRCDPCGANGLTHSGTLAFRCRGCDRRFVAAPKTGPVPDATKDLVRRLLAEQIGSRAIARAVGVSRSWAQGFVNALYRDHTPHDPGSLVIEADELWSFVGSKSDVHWVWVALDAGTRWVLAMVRGNGARLWGALPRRYRTGVTVYTDW